jgi:chorismate dehydratase
MKNSNNKSEYLVKTEDGTTTLFLEEYEQAMHSTSGAYEESLLKHVIPSRILEEKEKSINVLDIGFGLGYNVLALIHEYKERRMTNPVNIISLEKEKNFSQFMDQIEFSDTRENTYSLVKKAYNDGTAKEGNISISVISGDARNVISSLEEGFFTAVFQDPFSPSKNPELWSLEYFMLIFTLMANEGIMTTYSSALHIRRAMIEAGFYIGRGPSVGMKREGTTASKSELLNQLSGEEIKKIIENPKSTPYRDKNLDLDRKSILSERLNEIRNIPDKIKECHQAHQE